MHLSDIPEDLDEDIYNDAIEDILVITRAILVLALDPAMFINRNLTDDAKDIQTLRAAKRGTWCAAIYAKIGGYAPSAFWNSRLVQFTKYLLFHKRCDLMCVRCRRHGSMYTYSCASEEHTAR